MLLVVCTRSLSSACGQQGHSQGLCINKPLEVSPNVTHGSERREALGSSHGTPANVRNAFIPNHSNATSYYHLHGSGCTSVDEASQQSTLCKASGAPGGDDGPSSTNNKNNEDNKSTPGRMIQEKGKSFREIALGNYLILQNVFQNLENNDVGSCCRVNEFWRSIAHPLYVRHYHVKIDEEYASAIRSYRFKITAHDMYESKKVIYSEETLEGASEFLLEAAKASKIAISFLSSWVWDEQVQKPIGSFLFKTGKHVTKFVIREWNVSLSANSLYFKWLPLMPNLIHLDWDGSSFIDEYVDAKEESIQMQSLRIIQVGDLRGGQYSSILRILKMAPNLEEIWSFPVILVDALVETGKAFSVKSISLENLEDNAVKTSFRSISHLCLNLEAFQFISSLLGDPEYQLSVRRMLESSRDSLEYLSLPQAESFDFQLLPPMTSLKEIYFNPWLDSEGEMDGVKFFALNTELQRIFPNVSVVKYQNLPNYPDPPLNAYVYEEQFTSWGHQIKHLKLVNLSGNTLRPMSLLFPSIQHLEFQVRDCNELGVMLKEFGDYWPDMESFAVEVGMYSSDSECTLDSAFTGIPDVAVARLRDPPGLRKDHFSSEEIQNFKEGSVLRNLSKLKILKFFLEEYHSLERSRKLLGKLCAITAVSKEFGFQFVPDLKIVLQTSDKLFQEVSDALKASRLGTLVSYEVEYAKSS